MNGIEALRPAHARLADAISFWSAFGGTRISPPFEVLSERAALLDLSPAGGISANGSCRLVRCADGWIAANLPRVDDLDLVPALLEQMPANDPWQQLEMCAADRTAASLIAQANILGLAVTQVGETKTSFVLPVRMAGARGWQRRPRVVDLSALWAGPLCGALLAEAGCLVTKVESVHRPDTTAARSPLFDARLNGGKSRLAIDPYRPTDIDMLGGLILNADLVITSARPRGLASFGIDRMLAACTGCWIAITAHDDTGRIGFGDDCAAAASLLAATDDGSPAFLGDAIADPLAGLAAATVALAALATGQRRREHVSLASVARAVRDWQAGAVV